MPVQPQARKKEFPATLLAIRHGEHRFDAGSVKEVFDRFKPFVRRGKTLYIELDDDYLERFPRNVAGYEILVGYAKEHGMRIVGIDRRKISLFTRKRLEQQLGRFPPKVAERVAAKLGISSGELYKLWHNVTSEFINKPLRERSWLRRLREAQEGDIVVMHPVHAFRIAPKLGLKRQRVIWLHPCKIKELRKAQEYLSPRWLDKLRSVRGALRVQRVKQRRMAAKRAAKRA